MIMIHADTIVVKSSHSNVAACKILALGGPEDLVSINGIEVSREELEQLQSALLNFMNTGFFDVEM